MELLLLCWCRSERCLVSHRVSGEKDSIDIYYSTHYAFTFIHAWNISLFFVFAKIQFQNRPHYLTCAHFLFPAYLAHKHMHGKKWLVYIISVPEFRQNGEFSGRTSERFAVNCACTCAYEWRYGNFCRVLSFFVWCLCVCRWFAFLHTGWHNVLHGEWIHE